MISPTGRRRIINSVAPIRICDLGGWTDTWFARTGAVCNIAVSPYAEVQVRAGSGPTDTRHITIHARDFGERYTLNVNPGVYGRHALLEAAIDILHLPNMRLEIDLHSTVPVGCSTGTSAAICVALIGALNAVVNGNRSPYEIANLAHRVETEVLGLQSGIQDQLCSAYGGICFIDIPEYPHASVSRIMPPNHIWWELERRLLLVYLGRSHFSSEVHERVIRRLSETGPETSVLEKLRQAAHQGKRAMQEGDLDAWGRAMIANTEAQAELHPELVCSDAHAVVEMARAHGAVGWKVNGAGGEGGSLTILFGPEEEPKRSFIREIREENASFEIIPTHLSQDGIRCWETVE